jgi:hypothetical protein
MQALAVFVFFVQDATAQLHQLIRHVENDRLAYGARQLILRRRRRRIDKLHLELRGVMIVVHDFENATLLNHYRMIRCFVGMDV